MSGVTKAKTLWEGRKRILGMPISFTKYKLTEDKLITKRGFLSIIEDEVELYKVADKKLVLPLGQRIFGCGSIHINVSDVDTPLKIMQSIKAPREVLEQLDAAINIQKDFYRTRGRDITGSSDTLV
jgi:hypothetical protein